MARNIKQSWWGLSVQNNIGVNRLSFILTITLFLMGASNGAELAPLTHNLTAIKKIMPAPKLRLKNMDDEFVDIRDLKEKVVVVNFWATWCPPCRREMSSLERLYLATQDKNVVVLAVNVGEDIDTVFPFMGIVNPSPSFPILFDTDAKVMNEWKVRGLPTTYIINSKGDIVYRAVGGREFDHPKIIQAVINLNK